MFDPYCYMSFSHYMIDNFFKMYYHILYYFKGAKILKFMKSAFKCSVAIFSFILTMFAMSEAHKEKISIEKQLGNKR